MNYNDAVKAVKGAKGLRRDQRSNAALIPPDQRELMMIYRSRDGDGKLQDIANDLRNYEGSPRHDRGKLIKLAQKEDIAVRAVTSAGVKRAGWAAGDGSLKFESGLVYAKHPFNHDVYFPLANAAEELLREKHEAAVRLLLALGARKVWADGKIKAGGKVNLKIAVWELNLDGQGEVSTTIPWFRSLEAETRRFRRRRSLNIVEHPWIAHDLKLTELIDQLAEGRRTLKKLRFRVDSIPPLGSTALKRMKRDYDLDVGVASKHPTDITLTASF